MEECRRWEDPPISSGTHPTLHEEGSRILRKLAALSFPVPSWPCGPQLKHIEIIHKSTDHLKPKPNMYHAMEDLIQAAKDGDHTSTTNFIKNGPADHNPVGVVLKSLFLSGGRSDVDPEDMTIIGALTIPPSSYGLGSIDLLPERIKNDRMGVYELRTIITVPAVGKKKSITKLVPFWASCLIPMGAITGPHTDYCGSSQVIQHIEGRKVWLCWPPTPHNLDIYLRKYHSGYDTFSTEDAIDQLQDMELLLLDRDQTCFTLPGGTIHAVLTHTPSCHAGLKLWRMEDFKVAKMMYKIQSDIMDQPEKLDQATFKFLQDYFRDLKGELKKWDELRLNLDNGKVNDEIQQWILESEESIKLYKLSTK